MNLLLSYFQLLSFFSLDLFKNTNPKQFNDMPRKKHIFSIRGSILLTTPVTKATHNSTSDTLNNT